jgi:DNA-binding GntR family transcriptional regulator
LNLKSSDIDRSTTVDKVVAVLRRAMFDGDLNPGEQLREIALSRSLAVSRGTIREALRVLTADGLAVHSPNRGVTVRKLTAEEIDDIFAARLVLETEAARASAKCPDRALWRLEAAMADYAQAAATDDPLRAADAHVSYHAAMVGLVGSRRLEDMERSLMRDLQLVIGTIDKDRDDLPTEIKKHRTLTRLLTSRQVAEAIQCIADELSHAKSFVIQHCTAANQAGDPVGMRARGD